jgi:predicted Zn-dependent protease
MAQADFRVCPQCGTRNKATWEYCVRCSEDLHNVPVGQPTAASVPDDVSPAPEASPWLGLVGVAVVLGLLAYAGTHLRGTEPPSRPSPELFTIPTVPPAPVAAAEAHTVSEDAFEEGRRLLAKGDAAGAAIALARAVADAPDNAYYRDTYAKALLASGAPPVETLRQFQEAIRLAPQMSDFVTDLARAYDQLGLKAEAASTYARALDLAPDDARILREASALAAREGHPEAALPYLKRLKTLNPDDLVVQQELAHAFEKTGNKAEAVQAYRDILEKSPQAAVTRGLLAEIMLTDGKSEEAVALLREGIGVDPSAPLLHRTLASALERTGNVAEAIREYREYARLNPAAPDAQAMAERASRLEARVAERS